MFQKDIPTNNINGITDHGSYESLSSRDFKFVNHSHPNRFFKIRNRPFYLVKSRPSLETYSDALYTPATRSTRPFDGCLYDAELTRIDESCTKRGRFDDIFTIDNFRYSGDLTNLSTYDRPLLYLGYINPHYGHFLLESLSRWWALTERFGDIAHFLVHIHHPKVLELPFVRICLSAMHLDQKRIVFFDEPTKIKKVTVPQPSFQLESHVFTKYSELTRKILSSIDPNNTRRTDQPLYASRRLLKSGVARYKGEEIIEEFLAGRGVKIIHPQLLSFREQIHLFNKHTRIIGLAGSAMHNIIFTRDPKTVQYLTPHWVNPNCFLIDRCMDANSLYMQSCPPSDRLKKLIEKIMNKLRIKRTQSPHGFFRTITLDYNKVINWFKTAGNL